MHLHDFPPGGCSEAFGQDMKPEHKHMLSPSRKAQHTARWARTMTKWLITRSNKRGAKWQFVVFGGKAGAESYGIVDLMAIRKDHNPTDPAVKRGDLFEIILIQVKGGRSRFPTDEDIDRLKIGAEYHRARTIILAEWKKSEALQLYELHDKAWQAIPAEKIFG